VSKESAEKSSPKKEGLRERKRRETLWRIAETGLKLFMTNGYEATTLETIAEEAGISRRTFFYYFKSKEEILLAWQSGTAEAIRAAVLEQSTKQSPLDAVKNALLKLTTTYETGLAAKHMMEIDRLMRSNENLRARDHIKYAKQEQAVFEALCEMWPQAKRRLALRTVAMISIGAFRLAVDNWSRDKGKRPVASYLRECFAHLKVET
jgi:AcrR family transcriptional regulator